MDRERDRARGTVERGRVREESPRCIATIEMGIGKRVLPVSVDSFCASLMACVNSSCY